jgi:SpoVK/Ycf46/Vps4 family AAA+-type ATPase
MHLAAATLGNASPQLVLCSLTLTHLPILSVAHTAAHTPAQVVGRSEAAVARLFAAARAAAPCILFLDQIESVAAARGTHASSHGTMDRCATMYSIPSERCSMQLEECT